MAIVRDLQHDRLCRPVRQPRHPGCCLHPDVPPKRADPAIYSQLEQLSLGNEPNWNSPDITTNNWSPWRLYTAPEVRTRNLSPTVSAINVGVTFTISAFGIGMPGSALATHFVNLAPGAEQTIAFPLPQSVLDGEPSIATFVRLEHPTDVVTINNNGEQAIEGVFTSEAGRNLNFSFPVRNPSAAAQQINLSVNSNDVGAVVSPGSNAYAPFEQIVASLSMTIPGSLHGSPGNDVRREITVIAWGQTGAVIGGVTFIIRIDD